MQNNFLNRNNTTISQDNTMETTSGFDMLKNVAVTKSYLK